MFAFSDFCKHTHTQRQSYEVTEEKVTSREPNNEMILGLYQYAGLWR